VETLLEYLWTGECGETGGDESDIALVDGKVMCGCGGDDELDGGGWYHTPRSGEGVWRGARRRLRAVLAGIVLLLRVGAEPA
jgi:hypothetical protein